ncbi:cation:proton antiporter [Streptomyces paromomycinus]|uniref:cation:proton antiporter n=1 Tax=Streptomyces paromomycinus TaxID=92743 RepID=UPI0027D99D7C|nr:cation:proton antiporter [Streptomyces paromomycinus]
MITVVTLQVGDTQSGKKSASPDSSVLDTVGHFFLGAAVVLVASHILGYVASKLGQPRVTGEIVAGILLGPSLLGSLAPGVAGWLFPAAVVPMFNGLAQLGLVLFMFGVGQELASMRLRGAAPRAVLISQSSLLVPFAAGALVALPLMDGYLAEDVPPLAFVLFIGCALSITAFPVLARILSDLGLTRTRPGRLSLFAAAVGDGGSWLLLSLILSLAHGGDPMTVVAKALAVVAVIAVFVWPLRRLLTKLPDRADARAKAPALMVFLVAAVGVAATLTAALGIHQLIGALLVGLIWPHGNRAASAAVAPLADTAKTVLLPFFFLGFGLGVDLGSLSLDGGAGLVLLALLVVATVGKVAGPSLCARCTGLPWSEALTLGVLLNARGLTELVVLQIGYEAGIIDEKMLGLLTIVAITTTVMTTPLLKATGALREPPSRPPASPDQPPASPDQPPASPDQPPASPDQPAGPAAQRSPEAPPLALSGAEGVSERPAGRSPE